MILSGAKDLRKALVTLEEMQARKVKKNQVRLEKRGWPDGVCRMFNVGECAKQVWIVGGWKIMGDSILYIAVNLTRMTIAMMMILMVMTELRVMLITMMTSMIITK